LPSLQKVAALTGTTLGAKLEDIENKQAREFFGSHEFCKNWVSDLAVSSVVDYAYDCEGMEVNKLGKLYTLTEFGSVMFKNELFCFAVSTSGGPWVVYLKTGKVSKMAPSWHHENEMSDYVEHSWNGFPNLIEDIKKTGLEYTIE